MTITFLLSTLFIRRLIRLSTLVDCPLIGPSLLFPTVVRVLPLTFCRMRPP